MALLNKNQIIPLEITALSNEGMGIGRYENMVVFVATALPGDVINAKIVKVAKTHCYGIIEELKTSSALRTENRCAAFPQCGGCIPA